MTDDSDTDPAPADVLPERFGFEESRPVSKGMVLPRDGDGDGD